MAGLKESIFSDSPVAFWSFDEDRAGFEGNQILDEIANNNPLVINGSKYTLESDSLNDLETSGQYSCRIAKGGYNDTYWGDYITFFEGIHSSDFNFGINGFTIEFMYYKQRTGTFNDYGNPGYPYNNYSPIIKKGTLIDCRILDYYSESTSDMLYVNMFNGTRQVKCTENTYPIFWRKNHVVITFKIEQTDVNEYKSTLKLFINGRNFDTDVATHVDSWPNLSVIDSWKIAGTGGTSLTNDINTEQLTLDQMAIYDYAFTAEQVLNHFKKTQHYTDIIQGDYPQHYWRLNDPQDLYSSTLSPTVGGVNGTYYGQITRGLDGPPKLIESKSVKFELGASATIDSYSNGNPNPIISVNQAYTLEFWFKSGDYNRGVLFACFQENPNWNGLIIYLNSKDNQLSPGNIQVAESKNNWINSQDTNPTSGQRNNWNDDEWHHLIVRRTGTSSNKLQLWLDGELDTEEQFSRVSNGDPSQIHLMGIGPGNMSISGQMSELAFYQYTIGTQQIQTRWVYTTRYHVSGYTLLQGNPISATVRFYNHITGALLYETTSDPVTGEYSYHPPTDRYVDVLAFIPDNNTTRYRVHGPVKPAEFDDSHLI